MNKEPRVPLQLVRMQSCLLFVFHANPFRPDDCFLHLAMSTNHTLDLQIRSKQFFILDQLQIFLPTAGLKFLSFVVTVHTHRAPCPHYRTVSTIYRSVPEGFTKLITVGDEDSTVYYY
jgi:hypothetical protein